MNVHTGSGCGPKNQEARQTIQAPPSQNPEIPPVYTVPVLASAGGVARFDIPVVHDCWTYEIVS